MTALTLCLTHLKTNEQSSHRKLQKAKGKTSGKARIVKDLFLTDTYWLTAIVCIEEEIGNQHVMGTFESYTILCY